MKTSQQVVGLCGWLCLALAAAAVGGFASANAGAFYGDLIRPDWAPPAWVFAPVWSALYLTMGLASWLVWKAKGFCGARNALLAYGAQLIANALWTWLFFVWRQGALAFAEILLLWILIVVTIRLFAQVRLIAAMLLVPYLVWVTFASVLTFSTWNLNPDLLG